MCSAKISQGVLKKFTIIYVLQGILIGVNYMNTVELP